MRARRRDRERETGANEGILKNSILRANLKNGIGMGRGAGPAVYTRSTGGFFFDNEGELKSAATGAARFSGARMVRQYITNTEYPTASVWVKLNSTVSDAGFTALGGLKVQTFTPNLAAGTYLYQPSISCYTGNQTYTLSCYVKKINNNLFGMYIGAGGTSTFDLDALTAVPAGGALSAGIQAVEDGWVRCWQTATVPNTFQNVGLYRTSWVVGEPFYVTGFQFENVTGQSDTTPSEYVSNGAVRSNYLIYTDDFTVGATWVRTNCTATKFSTANPLNGVVDASRITVTATAATSLRQSFTYPVGQVGVGFSVYAKKGATSSATSGGRFKIENSTRATDIIGLTLNLDTGAISYTTGSGPSTATDAGGGWWKIEVSSSSGINVDGDVMVFYCGSAGGTLDAGDYVYYYAPMAFVGTVAPSSYVQVGAAWDPHGSGVDGTKYFSTNKDGTAINESILKGYYVEGARTNLILYSRDMTNAAWVKTNVTPALTATGICGGTNIASTLTATAGNGTCLQTITIAAAARSSSAYVKRRTGSGTIEFTRDNGTSWTNITSLINGSTFTRVKIENTSVLNPVIGFRIVTNGDAIDVDMVQDESGTMVGSPIATTTVGVTRNPDVLYYQKPGNLSDSDGTAIITYSVDMDQATHPVTIEPLGTDVNGRIAYCGSTNSPTLSRSYDGTNTLTSTGSTHANGALRKHAIKWTGATGAITSEGAGSVSSGSYDGGWGAADIVNIGGLSGLEVYGNIRDVAILPTAVTDAQLLSLVVP